MAIKRFLKDISGNIEFEIYKKILFIIFKVEQIDFRDHAKFIFI